MEIRKTKQELIGESRARKVINELITKSQWFEVTPYPGDIWVISVKYENENMLRRLIADSGPEIKDGPCRTEADKAGSEGRTVPSS
jgi:hypothetical protein